MKKLPKLAAVIIALSAVLSAPVMAQTVSIATLPPGSINNVQAQAIAKIVQENSDLQMRVVTYNSPAAIMGSTQVGRSDFSFTSNDEAGVAIEGKDEHEGKPMSDLRIAMHVISFKVGVLVRNDSDIKGIADLKGKRYPTGWQGFLQGIPLSNAMLATEGLSLDDVDGIPTSNLIRAADDFKAGRLDATIFAVGAPKMAEVNAAVDGGIRFLDLDNTPEKNAKMGAIRQEYHMADQKPAPYLAGVIGETTLMEYAVVILTNVNTSDDLVYKLVKAMYENKAGLVAAHPSFNGMIPARTATKQQRIEYHPGAIKFFKEVGIWKG